MVCLIKIDIHYDKLRNGEDVVCPECKKGILKTPYDPKTSKYFKCNHCGMMINED